MCERAVRESVYGVGYDLFDIPPVPPVTRAMWEERSVVRMDFGVVEGVGRVMLVSWVAAEEEGAGAVMVNVNARVDGATMCLRIRLCGIVIIVWMGLSLKSLRTWIRMT